MTESQNDAPYPGRSEPRSVHKHNSKGRYQARMRYAELGTCEVCGLVPAVERHHKDGDPHNNERGNVVLLCRRCHRTLDGRNAALAARAPILAAAKRTDPQPCAECGRLAKPTRRGLCHACYERRRRRGA